MPQPEHEKLVREYEKVIDEGYLDLPLLQRPLQSAVYGVLGAYDSHLVTLRTIQQANGCETLTVSQVQILKSLSEGLTWSLRWLLASNPLTDISPTQDRTLIDEGGELIKYGADYFMLSMMYSQYSQGTAMAVANKSEQRVRFTYDPNHLPANNGWGFFDDVMNDQSTPALHHTQARLSDLVAENMKKVPYQLLDGRIVLDDLSMLANDAMQEWFSMMCGIHHLFPPETSLGDFTIGQLNQFWRALASWSVSLNELYLKLFARGVPQESCLPTQVVERASFLKAISELSGVSLATTDKITSMLTFNPDNSKSDAFLQPFICTEDKIAWSTYIVHGSRFQRNFLKLMARRPCLKRLADNIIGDREQKLLADVRTYLENKGWTILLNIRIQMREECEIDLLGFHEQFPHEALVLEVKAFLQVDETNEIKSATKELNRGREQVLRVIRNLKSASESQLGAIGAKGSWRHVTDFYGALITPETEPGISFDQLPIPAASWRTIRSKLVKRDWRGPGSFWRALANRKWHKGVRNAKFSHAEIELAGVTFEIPLIELGADSFSDK